MSGAPIPYLYEPLTRKPFSFSPPIVNIPDNEWSFRQLTSAEMLVANRRSDLQVWIPRAQLGEVRGARDPQPVVELLTRFEYRGGTLVPHQPRPLHIVGGAIERPVRRWIVQSGSRTRRLLGALVLVGALAAALLIGIHHRTPVSELRAEDDYASVVRKLGPPAADLTDPGDRQYRVLSYPGRSLYLVLRDGRYVGALDRNWRVIDSVRLPDGTTTASVLRSLPRP